MTLLVDIAIDCEAWTNVPDLESSVERAVEAARSVAGFPLLDGAEVSVLLCDDARIQDLNRAWRGVDKPTNVLSFPATQPSDLAKRPLLGDIALAWETTWREALDEGKAPGHHASHLVVHGFLHLLGFDHVTVADAESMEALESRALATLGITDPYAGLELAETHTR